MRALVVIDMQNDFIGGSLGQEKAQETLQNVMKTVQDFEGDVFYTLDTHDEDYLDSVEGQHLPVLHCQKGSWGQSQPIALKKLLEEKVAQGIEKNSFGSLALVAHLKKRMEQSGKTYESILCVGICTDICVISNVLLLKSAFPNIPIWVEEKSCLGTTFTQHQNALEVMKSCHIEII